jgi:hypothetical protein
MQTKIKTKIQTKTNAKIYTKIQTKIQTRLTADINGSGNSGPHPGRPFSRAVCLLPICLSVYMSIRLSVCLSLGLPSNPSISRCALQLTRLLPSSMIPSPSSGALRPRNWTVLRASIHNSQASVPCSLSFIHIFLPSFSNAGLHGKKSICFLKFSRLKTKASICLIGRPPEYASFVARGSALDDCETQLTVKDHLLYKTVRILSPPPPPPLLPPSLTPHPLSSPTPFLFPSRPFFPSPVLAPDIYASSTRMLFD